MTAYRHSVIFRFVLSASACLTLVLAAHGQEAPAPDGEEIAQAPEKLDVNPIALDEEIRARLQNVLEATDWFQNPDVQVQEGVVFLNGQVDSAELKKWAGDLARNTQDVAAVVNRLEVTVPSIWDLTPAWSGLQALWRDLVRTSPFAAFGILTLALSAAISMFVMRIARTLLLQRIGPNLLRNVVARGIGIFVFLIGFYIVLRVSGLTQLALTVVGGTGLIGLVVGIAFRDITENFLASVFLSMQQPFETGDLVEAVGVTGYVQQLNLRTTVLMTLDGNVVQIPNASVYKSNLRNFTTNANRREVFDIGIGYDDSITFAQEIARKVLSDHPAVLNDPEPAVLVDSLGTATVNLKVYFWLDGHEHSWLKVRSSVIRLVKRAFQKNGITMPDEAREVVFPKGVPVTMVEGDRQDTGTNTLPSTGAPDDGIDAVSTKAEAGLYSEATVIEEQARQVQPLQEKENLLNKASGTTAPPPGTENTVS